VYASPILADGKLYYLSRSGTTYVLKAGPKYELLATNELSDRSSFDASLAVSDGRIYIRSNRFLYCVGEK
jgi:outer membrane protein assembly factor BamB